MAKNVLVAAVSYLLASLLYAPPVPASTMTVLAPSGGGFFLRVTSMKERRFRSTIKQQYDFSCGSAALATLLTYHYDFKVTEQEVFDKMFTVGDQEKIRSQGFSLLDMKNYLNTHGFTAAGYKASLDKLAEVGVPAIVLINIHGYKHFVVLKGVSATEVLLSDPASGNRTMTRAEFEPMWNGLLFLVRNRKDVASQHFNVKQEWKVQERVPLEGMLSNSDLSHINVLLR